MSTFARFIDDLTQVARKALAEPESGNWFSINFSYGDYCYQYAWYYKDGQLICKQCDNVLPAAALNIKSRALKRDNFGYMAPVKMLLAEDQHKGQLSVWEPRFSRWAIVKELLRRIWKGKSYARKHRTD